MYNYLIAAAFLLVALAFEKRLEKGFSFVFNFFILAIAAVLFVISLKQVFPPEVSEQNFKQLKVFNKLDTHIECNIITENDKGPMVVATQAFRSKSQAFMDYVEKMPGQTIVFGCREKSLTSNRMMFLKMPEITLPDSAKIFIHEPEIEEGLISIYTKGTQNTRLSKVANLFELIFFAIAGLWSMWNIYHRTREPQDPFV